MEGYGYRTTGLVVQYCYFIMQDIGSSKLEVSYLPYLDAPCIYNMHMKDC